MSDFTDGILEKMNANLERLVALNEAMSSRLNDIYGGTNGAANTPLRDLRDVTVNSLIPALQQIAKNTAKS